MTPQVPTLYGRHPEHLQPPNVSQLPEPHRSSQVNVPPRSISSFNNHLYESPNNNYLVNIDPDLEIIDQISPQNDINECSQYYQVKQFNELSTPDHLNFSLLNHNIRSFSKNGEAFEALLESMTKKPKFIVVTETWNNESIAQLCQLEGYSGHHVFRNNIVTRGGVGGGVSIFAENIFNTNKIDELCICDQTIEICSLRIDMQYNKYIVILGIYKPHSDTLYNFTEKLNNILHHPAVMEASLVLVAGDLNINICDTVASEPFVSLMYSNNFIPTILKPTRIQSRINSQITTETCLDHIWLGKIDSFISGIILYDISDHLPAFLNFSHNFKFPDEKIRIETRPYSDINFNSLCNDLIITNWDSVLANAENLLDPNDSCVNFIKHVDELYCKNFPRKIKFISQKRKKSPWFTSEIKQLIDKKSKAFKQLRLGQISTEANNLIRNEVNQAVRTAKANFYQSAFSQSNNNMKKNWNLLKNLLGTNKTKNEIEKIAVDGHEYTDPTGVADQFNNYFCSIADDIAAELPPVTGMPVSNTQQINNSLFLFPVTIDEVEIIINNLKNTNTGLNSIPVKIFKQLTPLLVPTICMIINISFSKGIFPDVLKIARITPVFKKGDRQACGNYRPIASLPFLSKIYERAMANRLLEYLNKYSILHNAQFGFLKGKSTSDAIHYLTDFIYKNLNEYKYTINVQIDLRKAFDTVDHCIFLEKIVKYGIRGLPHQLIKSYLTNRNQYVSIKGYKSDLKDITIGVPQGSILGPIFFLLFINDLPNCSEVLKSTLYADDTTLSIAHNNFNTACNLLNTELKLVQKWTIENRLTINIDKTELMIITNRSLNMLGNEIVLDGKYLQSTECSMFLGIKIDNKLKFTDHINFIVNKLSKSIGIFAKVKNKLPLNSRLNYYYCFVYPFITYNIIIWGKAYTSHVEPIITLHKRMVRLMKDADFLAHTNPLFIELNILKFEDIYKYFTSIFMFNAIKEGNFCTEHTLNTRNRDQAQPAYHRTTQGQQSLSYMGPKVWNELPNEIRNLKNLTTFKCKLKKHITLVITK